MKKLYLAIIVALIISSISSAQILSTPARLEDNNTIAANGSIPDANESRLFIERSTFQTKLIFNRPSRQQYTYEAPPAGVKEITYNSSGLVLKAWLQDDPGDGKKHPGIVFAHGGFAFGSEDWKMAQEFINQGYVLMMPTVRGENGNPGCFEYFYGEVNDVIAAGDYLSKVDYVDPDRIFLCGHSVGGTLSMLASMMPSKYRAIAAFSGSPDQKIFLHSSDRAMIPYDTKNMKETELRSPIDYADSIVKPLFVFLGDRESIFLDSSRKFAKKAKENGRPCEIYVSRGDHFSSVPESMKRCISEFNKL